MSELQTFYVIRHGETSWSLSGQHTGRSDIPLTPKGEQQARNLGEHLRTISFAKVLMSPRSRAQRTCELAGLSGTATIDADLAECDYGDYEGLRTADILQNNPHWNLWTDGSPNGESPQQISARADRVFESLRGLEGNIALFSHGHFSCALATRWIGLPIENAQHFVLDPAAFGVLGFVERHETIAAIRHWNISSEGI
ncbi:MAG TPA: histidine phosphatase family protein [Rudaea sp.]|jgi:probable phosphoglycerate mutase|nr:histidine phosphatase family protein [Rudaea sp.]